jgi:hypothetical protein
MACSSIFINGTLWKCELTITVTLLIDKYNFRRNLQTDAACEISKLLAFYFQTISLKCVFLYKFVYIQVTPVQANIDLRGA